QAYDGAVTVGNGVTTTLTSTGDATITFGNTVGGPGGLTVTTNGMTTFTGAVGGTPLARLAVNGGGTTQINGGSVTTTGNQTYDDAVTVSLIPTTFNATNTNATIAFNSTLAGAGGVNKPLTVTSH